MSPRTPNVQATATPAYLEQRSVEHDVIELQDVEELTADAAAAAVATVGMPQAPTDEIDKASLAPSKPPSFAQSEFQTIVRRQKCGTGADGQLKVSHQSGHGRTPKFSRHWEVTEWGSMRYLDITPQNLADAHKMLSAPRHYLNVLHASSIAGNDLTGSVFYAFPAIAAIAGVYSPICLTVACLLLLFFKPLLLELASAAHLNGANYVYLLQFSGKTLAMVGATATLLDAVCTSTVSAATASAYLSGEFARMPVSPATVTVVILVGLGLLALAGVKESARLSSLIFVFHLLTMFTLAVVSAVHLGRHDPHAQVLKDNWAARPPSTFRALFFGTCISFLGVTGFECTPSYIEHLRPRTYNAVLRNHIIMATLLNSVLGFFVFAVLPTSTILSGANILSALAEVTAGSRWLRYVVVVDAVSVLLGGVLTGVVTAGQLFDRLARDHMIPKFFLLELPVTKGTYVASLTALGLSLLLYIASGLSLQAVSSMFSVSFLFELFLYVVSTFLLKLNRPNLPVRYRATTATLATAFVVVMSTWIGNVIQDPISLALFAGAFAVAFGALLAFTARSTILSAILHVCNTGGSSLNTTPGKSKSHAWMRGWREALERWYAKSRTARVCVWIKTDDIHTMMRVLLSVQRNSPDARTVVFVHAYAHIARIPSELRPNTRLLDEAFPTLTVDLTFVQGSFSPELVQAVSCALDIPRSRMCIVALRKDHPWTLADYGGARVIA